MNRQAPDAFPLFDLLARRWAVRAPVVGLSFNASRTRLAATLADGAVALVDCADPEPPESRIAVDDSGRRTITPRRIALRPAQIVSAVASGSPQAVRGPDDAILIAYPDASLWRLSPSGEMAPLAKAAEGPLLAIDRCDATATTAVVTAEEIELRPDSGSPVRAKAPGGVRTAALSPDGKTIAFGCSETLELAPAASPAHVARRFESPAPLRGLFWRPDGAFLAAAGEAGGFALIDLRSQRFGFVGGFPTPPRSIAWSAPANAVVASGAFRIAAWDLDHPPFDGDRSGALETGRTGLVAVELVAAHPARKLVAAAYGNGQIVIAQPGARDELALKIAGPTPTALVWSSDGKMLAVADSGAVSLVTLPDALFKS